MYNVILMSIGLQSLWFVSKPAVATSSSSKTHIQLITYSLCIQEAWLYPDMTEKNDRLKVHKIIVGCIRGLMVKI